MGQTRHLPLLMKERKNMAETTKQNKEERKTKTLLIPRDDNPKAPTEEFFSINFKNYLIKKGEPVEVPEELYNVWMEQQKAKAEARAYLDEHPMRSN